MIIVIDDYCEKDKDKCTSDLFRRGRDVENAEGAGVDDVQNYREDAHGDTYQRVHFIGTDR